MSIKYRRKAAIFTALAFAATAATTAATAAAQGGRRFEVTIAPDAHAGPVTGRLILLISKTEKPEPRFAASMRGPAAFGLDLDQVQPGRATLVDNKALGYPVSLAEVPAGDYYVQAVVNVYTQVHRADGHTIWIRDNDGRAESFGTGAGNLYSDVQRIHLGDSGTFRLAVTHVVPPPREPHDTEWLKHVRIQSQKLTKFWGHPVYIRATVLLPKGYAEHPAVYYPAIYPLGHGSRPFGFTPDSTGPRFTIDAAAANRAGPKPTVMRRGAEINRVTGIESGYDFYKSWTSDDMPRVIAITFEQATPYFPDSYSVNSANNGPYGDAITQEVIPYLEQHFRIIAKPYARQVEGASTSGWQTLALQLQHPDFFGGAWVLQPDPIDFRHYQLTNIYDDDNAFSLSTGQFTSTPRFFQRTTEGQMLFSTQQLSRYEAVLGDRGRSGGQLEGWEAVYGPVGPDGYPVPVWDKLTGKIDHTVAGYMRDHGFDLRYYAEKNWTTLGPKVVGKLHFFAGDMDNFYLNVAVYDFQDFLQSTTNPHYEGDFTFGRPMKGHSWHSFTWNEMVRKMAAAIKGAAPSGENTSAWHY